MSSRSHPTCYAAGLGDCAGKITKEHFISAALIKYRQPDPSRIDLAGVGGNQQPTGVQRLANRKMLCERHNSQLSILDEEVYRLVQTIFEFNRGERTLVDEEFDGNLITRWMQKYLYGASVAFPTDVPLSAKIDRLQLLRYLFGHDVLPDNWGLLIPHVFTLDNFYTEYQEGYPSWAVGPLPYPGEDHIGAEMQIFPVRFRYVPNIGPFTGDERYRPKRITLTLPSRKAVIDIAWKGFSGGDVNYSLREGK